LLNCALWKCIEVDGTLSMAKLSGSRSLNVFFAKFPEKLLSLQTKMA
jgi:hypothetical protein